MTNHALKKAFAQSIHPFAQKKALDQIQLTGKALPCSVVSVQGAIITVKFEIQDIYTLPNVTVPLFGPIYIRYPIQKGDKGMVIPADAYLGGMSGLGGGTANLTRRGNLSALVFLPIANTDWATVDPQSVTIYGPNGVVLRDTDSHTTFTLTPSSINIVVETDYKITVGNAVFEMQNNLVTWTVGSSSISIIPGQITLGSPLIALNGQIIQTGFSGGAGTVSILGPVVVTNELTAGGVGMMTHKHTLSGGSGTGGIPVIPS
jgi:hypothetical protein